VEGRAEISYVLVPPLSVASFVGLRVTMNNKTQLLILTINPAIPPSLPPLPSPPLLS